LLFLSIYLSFSLFLFLSSSLSLSLFLFLFLFLFLSLSLDSFDWTTVGVCADRQAGFFNFRNSPGGYLIDNILLTGTGVVFSLSFISPHLRSLSLLFFRFFSHQSIHTCSDFCLSLLILSLFREPRCCPILPQAIRCSAQATSTAAPVRLLAVVDLGRLQVQHFAPGCGRGRAWFGRVCGISLFVSHSLNLFNLIHMHVCH